MKIIERATVYKKGHPLHPEGRVVVLKTDNDGNLLPVENYTLEEWAALQSSQ
ncbi:hypothetical protein [Kordiimonas sp.]|uniref:hypothetical protein n=1 Tax=Kordiimonas sp. TaxID=1970157 RepID=UPI003B523C75